MKFKLLFVALLTLTTVQFTYAQWQINGTNLFYNNGNVGLGTNTPANRLHILNGGIRITPNTLNYEGLRFTSGQADFATFRHITNADGALFEMNLQPALDSLNAVYRFFRLTNTIGIKAVDFFRGNNTTQRSARIGVDGLDSYFQMHGGNFGIGTSTPDFKLSVRGEVPENSSLAHLNASSIRNGAAVLTLSMAAPTPPRSSQDFLRFIFDNEEVASITKFGGATFGGSVRINSSLQVSNGDLSVINPNDNANIFLTAKNGKKASIGLQDDNNQGFYVKTDDTYRLSINQNGNVGIGVTAPASKLHIDGDIRLQSPNNQTYALGVNGAGSLEFRGDGGKVAMVIGDVLGNIGIGTTNPDAKLHVNGDFRLQSPNNHTYSMGVNNNGDLEFRGDGGKAAMIISDVTGNVGIVGNVGIGTISPNSKLHLHDGGLRFTKSGNQAFDIKMNNTGDLEFWRNGNGNMAMVIGDATGNVGIGIVPPNGYRLAVDGRLICEEVRVQLSSQWPDYVFSKGYQLKPLEEVEQSIKTNGHLPGMPSATEVETNGLTLGEMQAKMMEKIEELTLYMIELKKENEELKKQINRIKR